MAGETTQQRDDEETPPTEQPQRRGGRRRLATVLLGLLAVVVLGAPLLTTQPLDPVPHFAEHRPTNIAHAGAQGHAPPNTIEAFALALELGADTLEMDLQLTADGEVVVHHDGTVDRQTDGSGAIIDMTLAELRELDAGYSFEDEHGEHPYRGQGIGIPTLEEVFEAFPETFMVIEMKTDGGQEIVEAVADRVQEYGREDSLMVASFSLDYLLEMRERLPGVPTNMPEGEGLDFHIRQIVGLHRWWAPPAELLQVPEYHNDIHVATNRFFAAAGELGVDSHVWTVNDPDDMRRFIAAGAQGIITDYPDLLADVIAERESGEPLAGADRGDVTLIEWLQERLPWLIPVMQAVTFVGDEEFYVLALAVLFWAVSYPLALRLGVMLLLSAGLNEAAKTAVRSPRPYFLDPGLGFVSDTTPGIPSGHAQNGLVFWGVLAAEVRRRWVWFGALALILLLGLSRLHLGAHYPIDVLVGWAVGGVVLLGYLWLRDPVGRLLVRLRPKAQVWTAFAASLVLILLAVAGRLVFLDWQPPVEWVGIDAQAWPVGVSHTVTPAGALFGVGVGLVLLRRHGGFRVAGPVWQRIARCVVGLIGLLVIWQGLGTLFPSGEDAIALVYRYLRYALIGAWISGIAPLLFVRLGLAAPSEETAPRADATGERSGAAV